MAVMTKVASNRETEKAPTQSSVSVMDRVNEILGYDIAETEAVELDAELFSKLLQRRNSPNVTIPAADVLGD